MWNEVIMLDLCKTKCCLVVLLLRKWHISLAFSNTNKRADMNKDQTYFQEKWMDSELYKDWMAPVKNDNTQARCTKCKYNFLLSNMGAGALNSHSKGGGHKGLVKQVNCFFKPTSTKDKAEKKTTDKPSNSLTQQSLELTVQKSLTTNAEIRFLWSVL